MSKLRVYGFAAALLVLLGGNALAASRDDGSCIGVEKLLSRIQRIVRILDDVRVILPPG
jgi:hypothetical protein